MNIHRVFYPVETLGPGKRIGIWTRGCRRRCAGCLSPELWETDPRCEMPLPLLTGALGRLLAERPVDGVTISGGEPLLQKLELVDLLAFLRRNGVEDILLYTGFTRGELGARAAQLAGYATLVCGPYERGRDDGGALRGSANQDIIFAGARAKARYAPLLAEPRTVQVARGSREVFTVGIPPGPGAGGAGISYG